MKKKICLLTCLVLAICLTGFALDHGMPARTAHAASFARAASEDQPAASSAGQPVGKAIPPAGAASPVVFVVTGLVCGLFGIIAVSPLLTGDPVRPGSEDEI